MALKKYLLINSCFSFICGLCMLILNLELSTFFHVSQPIIFTIIGLNLLLFAAFVLFTAMSNYYKNILVTIIIVLDALWVTGSACIVLLGIFNLSFNGYLSIALVGLFIAFLAFKQYTNLQDVKSKSGDNAVMA